MDYKEILTHILVFLLFLHIFINLLDIMHWIEILYPDIVHMPRY